VVGPILGGFLSDRYGFPALFLLVAALSIPSVILIKSKLSGNLELRASTGGIWKGISALKPITFAYVTLIPFAIVLGIYMAILPGHMGVIGISASAIGFLLTLTNAVRGVGFFSSEYWVKWDTRKSIWVSSILLCGAFFIVSFSEKTIEFVLPLSVFGFAGGIITPVILDYIAHRSPNESLGAAMGLHEFVYGIGMSLGPIIGGAIAENFNPTILYQLLAILVLFIIPSSLRMGDNGES
jgi:MFS family permease